MVGALVADLVVAVGLAAVAAGLAVEGDHRAVVLRGIGENGSTEMD